MVKEPDADAGSVTVPRALADSLVVALKRSTAPKSSDLAWWSPEWDPARHLWGAGEASGPSPAAREEMVTAVRAALGEDRVDFDDDTAVRLYCGAMLEAMAASAEVDGDRRLLAAWMLLGLAPRSFYGALADPEGAATWAPLGLSREQLRAALKVRYRSRTGPNKPQGWLDEYFDPDKTSTRRVLVSYLLTGGKLSYDSWGTGGSGQLDALATTLHRAAVARLGQPVERERLLERLGLTPVPPAATGAHAERPRAPRWRHLAAGARRVAGPPRVAAVAAVILVVATGTTYAARAALHDRPDGRGAATGGATPPSDPLAGPSNDAETAAEEPTTPLLGTFRARNLSFSQPWDSGFETWAGDIVLGDRIALRLELSNPSEETIPGVALQVQAEGADQWVGSEDSTTIEKIELRVRTEDTGLEFSIPLDESPPEEDADGVLQVHPADVFLSAPDNKYDGCSTSGQFVPDEMAYMTSSSDPTVTIGMDSWDLPAGTTSGVLEGKRLIGRYLVGDVAPGETVTVKLRGTLQLQPSAVNTLDGGPSLEVGVNDREWGTLDSARVGDTVTAKVLLHDSSCATEEGEHVVQMRSSTSPRGVITLEATGDSDVGLGRARINLVGTTRARLEPVPGTTWLYGYRTQGLGRPKATCGDPVKLATLPDGVLQAGVQVAVAGYTPREPCLSHVRWVMTDLRIVGD